MGGRRHHHLRGCSSTGALRAWARLVGLCGLLTACYPATVAPGDLPTAGLEYVQSVSWGSVGTYEAEYAQHAGTASPYPGVDWFRNGCADQLAWGYAVDFTPACHLHDFAYRNLRLHASTHTGANRKAADELLYAHMRATCAVKEAPKRRACDRTAAAMYGFVRVFGGFYFGWVW